MQEYTGDETRRYCISWRCPREHNCFNQQLEREVCNRVNEAGEVCVSSWQKWGVLLEVATSFISSDFPKLGEGATTYARTRLQKQSLN
jgi:hypothetical protein